MFQHLVVPVDGSASAWRAVPIAARMAAAVDGKLDVVTVVDRIGDVSAARAVVQAGLSELGALAVEPMSHVLARDSVAGAVADHLDSMSGGTVVMSSHGRGRSSAVLGSVTDEVLRRCFGPIVVVGPQVGPDVGSLGGTYVIPVDGSERSNTVVPIAGAWAVEFGATPWIVEVLDPNVVTAGLDVVESSYVKRVALDLQSRIGREVEYEALHGEHPARAIVDFADVVDAALLFCSTHGRTGMARLRIGSVAAEVVRHATCPVVLYRPPELPE